MQTENGVPMREILTPEQAADYLQVNRETVYRYIREGKLVASKLGRAYRIPRPSLELLLWTTRTRKDIALRDYTRSEIDEFLAADKLDEEARQVAERFALAAASDNRGQAGEATRVGEAE